MVILLACTTTTGLTAHTPDHGGVPDGTTQLLRHVSQTPGVVGPVLVLDDATPVASMDIGVCTLGRNGQPGTDLSTSPGASLPDAGDRQALGIQGDFLRRWTQLTANYQDWWVDDEMRIDGLVDAQLTDDGVVVLNRTAQGCQATWWTWNERTRLYVAPDAPEPTHTLELDDCAGDFVAAPDGTAWLATGDRVLQLDTQVSELPLAGEHVAWADGVLVVGGPDGLSAWDGQLLWQDELPVTDLAALGDRPLVAVMGGGQLEVLYAPTGQIMDAVQADGQDLRASDTRVGYRESDRGRVMSFD